MLSYSWGMTSNKCGCEAHTPSLVPPIEASPLLIYSHCGQPNGGVWRPPPNGGVVARKQLKDYFLIPHTRPVPVKVGLELNRSAVGKTANSLVTNPIRESWTSSRKRVFRGGWMTTPARCRQRDQRPCD